VRQEGGCIVSSRLVSECKLSLANLRMYDVKAYIDVYIYMSDFSISRVISLSFQFPLLIILLFILLLVHQSLNNFGSLSCLE
jgi:hypothetical protein